MAGPAPFLIPMSPARRTIPRRTRETAGPVHDGLTIAALRRFAVARSLFQPTSLPEALDTLGFVQADPIRAPARAQDLTLRHRVAGYRAGDLERAYPDLDVFEDFFVNYGFVTRAVHALMHPRGGPRAVERRAWPPRARAAGVRAHQGHGASARGVRLTSRTAP